MASKKSTPAPAAEVAAEPEAVATDLVTIYPTHRRQEGPLVVSLPSDGINSEELVVTDDGLAVDQATADHLIAAREATLEAPAKAEDE
jgi:hypothetical protein